MINGCANNELYSVNIINIKNGQTYDISLYCALDPISAEFLSKYFALLSRPWFHKLHILVLLPTMYINYV